MEENVGGLDLYLRATAGSAAIVLLALDLIPEPWGWVVGLTAFIGLHSSVTRHCTPYALIGFSTAREENRD
jgi:hypothetical protein